jgi:flagellar motor protein MotB
MEHEESFFVSMTDMMVGMLFLFIIMLMFFALKFSDDSVDLREQNRLLEEQRKAAEEEKTRLRAQLDLLQGAQQARRAVVEQVYSSLKQQGVTVLIDRDNGILRLPESILFDVGRAELSPEGREAVAKLARALADVLPCYAKQPGSAPPEDCPATAFGIVRWSRFVGQVCGEVKL